MEKYLFIGLGGFLGSIARYALSNAVYRTAGESFPFGTLTVNIIGCFVIGLFMTLFQDRMAVQPNLRFFLIIGVLGGFTTFSSFSYETFALMKAGNFFDATVNSVLSLIGCLLATWGGYLAGKNF
ncbi:MAG: fluoride efflux transporter CrcB [Bacteroidota bacterium]|jgi:CrcB protein